MDAEAFMKAIAGRLRSLARAMARNYAEAGITADDLEQEAAIVLLSHPQANGRPGSTPKPRSETSRIQQYDPEAVEPWTFALPIARVAMLRYAAAEAKASGFVAATNSEDLKKLAEQAKHFTPKDGEDTETALSGILREIGLTLSPDEITLASLTFGDGLTEQEAADVLGSTRVAIQRRLRNIREQIREAAARHGRTAFPDAVAAA